MMWQQSDKRILFTSDFAEDLVYDTDHPNPETYQVIVISINDNYEGSFPQHKGYVYEFLTTLLLKVGVRVMIRNTNLIISTFDAQADGLYLVRCSTE